MTTTRDRLHAIGWGTALAVCFALTVGLTMRVNAVKSQVTLANRQIAQLSEEKLYLETEFETRASQPQLRAMNDVDFGFVAPNAGQYLKSERDLAALGKPAAPDAPQPIRVAAATDGEGAAPGLPGGGATLAGRLIGVARAAEMPARSPRQPLKVASLNERLSRLDRPTGARE